MYWHLLQFLRANKSAVGVGAYSKYVRVFLLEKAYAQATHCTPTRIAGIDPTLAYVAIRYLNVDQARRADDCPSECKAQLQPRGRTDGVSSQHKAAKARARRHRLRQRNGTTPPYLFVFMALARGVTV